MVLIFVQEFVLVFTTGYKTIHTIVSQSSWGLKEPKLRVHIYKQTWATYTLHQVPERKLHKLYRRLLGMQWDQIVDLISSAPEVSTTIVTGK